MPKLVTSPCHSPCLCQSRLLHPAIPQVCAKGGYITLPFPMTAQKLVASPSQFKCLWQSWLHHPASPHVCAKGGYIIASPSLSFPVQTKQQQQTKRLFSVSVWGYGVTNYGRDRRRGRLEAHASTFFNRIPTNVSIPKSSTLHTTSRTLNFFFLFPSPNSDHIQ